MLHVNGRCRVEGIPDEAHLYNVNGKTPLEWALDRLKVTTDKASGIRKDPNRWHEWANQPYNLIVHLQRLVRVSVETQRIVSRLPAGPSGGFHSLTHQAPDTARPLWWCPSLR